MNFERAKVMMRRGYKVAFSWMQKDNEFFFMRGSEIIRNDAKTERQYIVINKKELEGEDYKLYGVLDYTEQAWLRGIVKPFKRKNFVLVTKHAVAGKEFIELEFYKDGNIAHTMFPCFTAGSMYKGMKLGQKYNSNDLGLGIDVNWFDCFRKTARYEYRKYPFKWRRK